jgi:hypothetical protein
MILSILALTLLGAPPDLATIPAAERAAEDERLRALGLTVPEGGVILEHPFAQPFTNRSYLVPAKWFDVAAPKEVKADDLLEDLPILRAVMERAYAGWDTARKKGFDWDRWFSDWQKMLEARKGSTLPIEEAFAPWGELMKVQLDNHTAIAGARFGSGSRTAVLESPPKGACEELRMKGGALFPLLAGDKAHQPRRARHFEPGKKPSDIYYISTPSRRGEPEAIRCGNAWIPLRPSWNGKPDARMKLIGELAGESVEVPTLIKVREDVAYLRLPTFTKVNTEKIRQTMPSWPKPTGKERALIVDLRMNGGGDAAVDAVSGWVDQKDLQASSEFPQRIGASCLYTALRWGYTVKSSRKLTPPISEEMRQELQSELDGLFAPSEPECPAKYIEKPSAWNYTKHKAGAARRKGKPLVLVLVDNGCGSDCEYMAYVLAGVPEAVIAGVNTYGVGQFIQPGYSVLPNTRVGFSVALGNADEYGDGRAYDGHGLDVDVLLSTEQAWSRQGLLELVDRLTAAKK